ncbi:hypothetical protein HXX76_013407 [Chlamydomonas incerta]|uniref:Uncharacterized protein n=1 Tax=Chlamydomonas incerta TaxID=51695 RepID=A0A835SSC3_CHLIN|nr:hypothetical protein HXX76_013405 [Chlamydomonas incerta]KAG2425782.1 hypothetical protein HXX76_013407 [Chlamydomonas incerta]|eukprot:KAG2425780.1 hypothetical protein HXX76_013405 [Chlamydomonas incerta]
MEPAGFKARLRPLTLERNIDAHPPSIEAVRMLVVNALTMCGTLPEDEDIAFARLFLSRYSEIEKQFLL